MKLGFVSAILPDLSLEEVLAFGKEAGYRCVELMCWPAGKAERRYAGVTHIDVTTWTSRTAAEVLDTVGGVGALDQRAGLLSEPAVARRRRGGGGDAHIRKVIEAAQAARRARGEHLRGPRLDEVAWTTTGRVS